MYDVNDQPVVVEEASTCHNRIPDSPSCQTIPAQQCTNTCPNQHDGDNQGGLGEDQDDSDEEADASHTELTHCLSLEIQI